MSGRDGIWLRPARPTLSGSGFTLLELLIVLSLVTLMAGLSLPAFFRSTSQLRVELAAAELSSALRLARLYAIRHGTNVAVKFRTHSDGHVTFALYRDGDGDGVRNRDIDAGIDQEVTRPRRLHHLGRGIRFGFPPGDPPPHPTSGRPLMRLDDPIRFNRSDLASFSSWGGATPGSLYLTDGRRNLMAVRVMSRTGTVKTQRYDPESRSWERI